MGFYLLAAAALAMRAAVMALPLLAVLAAALPAAHGESMYMDVYIGTAHAQSPPGGHAEEMAEYDGDGFRFMHPASWSVHDAAVAEWDGWRVPVWAFGSDGQSIDSRLYVAEIPP